MGELKIPAGEKQVTVVEAQDVRVMFPRNNDFITLGGGCPRLTRRHAKGQREESKKLLLALGIGARAVPARSSSANQQRLEISEVFLPSTRCDRGRSVSVTGTAGAV